MTPSHSDAHLGDVSNGATLTTTHYYALRDAARNAQADQIKRLVLAVAAPRSWMKRVVEWLRQHLHAEAPCLDHRPSRP